MDAYSGYLVLLLNTKGLSYQLDLTKVNKLIILDQDWNENNDKMLLQTMWRFG